MSSTTSSAHDVVIVGARAAGAATAMLLARAGLDVVVVDRGRYGADTLSTHALMRAGVLQLHRWGLLDAVIAAGTPAVRNTTFFYADDVVPITVKPSHGVDALYAPRRTVLDPILVDAARAAGAAVEYATTVTAVTRDGTGRVNGIEGHHHGRSVRYTARWVIGADGHRSVVADTLQVPVERLGTAAAAVTYGYCRGVDLDGYQWVFRPDACAGAIPTNSDETCVFAAATPGRIGRGGATVLRDVLRVASPQLAGRVAKASPLRKLRTFGGHPGYLRRPWGPGWALVGDAGYWKDPISAHGLTDALRDAELLARAITTAIDADPSAAFDALDHYHHTRNRLSVPLFDVVDTIAGMRWTDDEIPGLLLQLSSAMSDEVEALDRLDKVPAILGAALYAATHAATGEVA